MAPNSKKLLVATKIHWKGLFNVSTSKTNLQTTTRKRSTDNNDLQKIKCKKLLLATKIKQKIPARGNLDVSEDWRLPFKM